jgi:uncharacterized protein (TIGR03437 family)
MHAADFSLVTEQNPAHSGEYLAAFVTGFGATDPPAVTGEPAAGPARVAGAVEAALDSRLVTVSYAGLAPGWVGLYQINFRLDGSITPGLKELYFSVSGQATNPTRIRVVE